MEVAVAGLMHSPVHTTIIALLRTPEDSDEETGKETGVHTVLKSSARSYSGEHSVRHLCLFMEICLHVCNPKFPIMFLWQWPVNWSFIAHLFLPPSKKTKQPKFQPGFCPLGGFS